MKTNEKIIIINSSYALKTETPEIDMLTLQGGYNEIVAYAHSNNIPLNLDYATFVSEYQARPYNSVNEYVDVYYSLLVAMQEEQPVTRSSGS